MWCANVFVIRLTTCQVQVDHFSEVSKSTSDWEPPPIEIPPAAARKPSLTCLGLAAVATSDRAFSMFSKKATIRNRNLSNESNARKDRRPYEDAEALGFQVSLYPSRIAVKPIRRDRTGRSFSNTTFSMHFHTTSPMTGRRPGRLAPTLRLTLSADSSKLALDQPAVFQKLPVQGI